jgi:hypothetical protein
MDYSDIAVLEGADYMAAYDLVEREAKAFLDQQPATAVFSTEALANELWQDETAKIPPRLWRGLTVRSKFGLAPYVSNGAPVRKFGRMVTPLNWHKERTKS